jgi:hypothetical protein
MKRKAVLVALLIYGSISAGAAGIFFAATSLSGPYPAVARFGGAVWIFVLAVIVTMPLVIPHVQARVGTPRTEKRD